MKCPNCGEELEAATEVAKMGVRMNLVLRKLLDHLEKGVSLAILARVALSDPRVLDGRLPRGMSEEEFVRAAKEVFEEIRQ